jgi:hypothetical protein
LKGHGFSRAAKSTKQQRALAPEGSILLPSRTIPQVLNRLRKNLKNSNKRQGTTLVVP